MNRLQTRWKSGIARIGALAAAVLLTVVTCLTVTAAEVSGSGTLTILPKDGNTVLAAADYDGTFTVYRVADYNTTGVFTNAADFAAYDEYSINKSTLSDASANHQLAASLTNYIAEHQSSITPVLETVRAGDVNPLAYGVYLIAQEHHATQFRDCTAFLVMIPAYGDHSTETNVTAYPKVERATHEDHDGDTPTTPARYGKVALGKSDSETGLPLQGVVFNLSRYIDEDWDIIGTYTTDENGVIYVDRLAYGSYRFVEAEALDGYIEDKTPQEFVIDSEETVQLTMTNTPIPPVPTPEEPAIRTGDGSNMMLYGAVAGVAVIALIAWIIWRRRSAGEEPGK